MSAACEAGGVTVPTLLVVDAANVVGSVPDGWWRDRAGATARLRDRLAALAGTGVAGLAPPLDILLVVEGAARGVPATDGVRVLAASGSGDDAIVELLGREPAHRLRVVVTGDRELRDRVGRLGAQVLGPRTVR
jgi:hypothetical protein